MDRKKTIHNETKYDSKREQQKEELTKNSKVQKSNSHFYTHLVHLCNVTWSRSLLEPWQARGFRKRNIFVDKKKTWQVFVRIEGTKSILPDVIADWKMMSLTVESEILHPYNHFRHRRSPKCRSMPVVGLAARLPYALVASAQPRSSTADAVAYQ